MGDALPFVGLRAGRTAQQVKLSRSEACVLLDTDLVKCFGADPYVLGLGANLDYNNQTAATMQVPFRLREDEYLMRPKPQLSDDDDTAAPDAFPPINLGGHPVQLTAVDSHFCAILDNDAVKCWGKGLPLPISNASAPNIDVSLVTDSQNAVCDCDGQMDKLQPRTLSGPGCSGRTGAYCLRREK